MLKLSINIDTSSIDRLAKDIDRKMKTAVGKGMSRESKSMASAVRSHVASQLKVQKQSFLQNYRVKVLDGGDMPVMRIYSRGKWSGVFEKGITIGGEMLIPINGRVGRKQFKAYVEELMRSGNAFFIKKGGKTILMAENIKENDRPLVGFKRRHRKAEGIKRSKRGTEIPIAILVSKVTVAKRLDVEGVARESLPGLKTEIEREIARIAT